MRQFGYRRASSVDKTITHLQQTMNGDVQPLVGGTDLLTLMKGNLIAPTELLDLKRLNDMPTGIEATGKGFSIGALTTLREIETSATIGERLPLLSEAAGLAATPQLRNMATVGGNLLQRPRCWYYRNELINCWLKGGDTCPAYDGQNEFHALFGGGPCYAVHPSDLAAALLALEAEATLRGSTKPRTLPLTDFFMLPTADHRRETVIADDELLLRIDVPALPDNTHSTYLKAMDRKVWAFALVGVAAVVRMAQGKIADVRLALSGVAPIPWRATAAEAILQGQVPHAQLFAQAATKALEGAELLAHNAYKVPLAQNLIQQALTTLTADN